MSGLHNFDPTTWPGRVVYQYHSPQKIGRIQGVLEAPKPSGAGWFGGRVRVMWLKKGHPVEDVPQSGLSDYESLVLETEAKAKGHRAIYEAALKET